MTSKLLRKCSSLNEDGVSVPYFLYQMLLNRILGRKLLLHQKVRLIHRENVDIQGFLQVGIQGYGFLDRDDRTLLNIAGKLSVSGRFSIMRGARLDIGKNAICTLRSGFIGPFTRLIIQHGLDIGADCAIAWNCEFLDDDFHQIEGVSGTGEAISIGSHVWVGSGCKFLRGAKVADGSIVAANSLVNKAFTEPNVLLAGTPAKIVKRDVKWS